ncbi:MAG: hypothetical protein ACOX2G_06290 [Bacillota bacterium]
MELYTVDSVSDGIIRLLLCRDETVRVEILQSALPGVQEGDIISAEIVQGALVNWAKDQEARAAAMARIGEKLERLKNRARD